MIYFKLKYCDWNDLSVLKNKLFDLHNTSDDKTIQPYYSLLLSDNPKLHKKIAQRWSKKFKQLNLIKLKIWIIIIKE